ncbi:MAG: phosphonate ABC transporter ATP-binding protein [Coriobacteriales bacterium]|jgi:phosphonate transport system ATP-binding protein|nr:phosphonate ABC transporter ATP-binding protein [Coriobacteriales bacterium]
MPEDVSQTGKALVQDGALLARALREEDEYFSRALVQKEALLSRAILQNDVLLKVAGITKHYTRERPALHDISFELCRGELVSVIGPSGAGKSTLLRCINRMIEPTSGSLIFDGQEVCALRRHRLRAVRRKMSMIFQHYNLVHRLTTIENVLHGRLGYKSTLAGMLGLYSEDEKAKALDILAQLDILEFCYVRTDQLSGGQKQRVGIARALMQDPLLMLCDEPIASLDPKSSRVIMDYLRLIADTLQISCLVNLHQVDYALEYSDRIIALREGALIFDGVPGEFTPEIISEVYGLAPGGPQGPKPAPESPEPVRVLAEQQQEWEMVGAYGREQDLAQECALERGRKDEPDQEREQDWEREWARSREPGGKRQQDSRARERELA